jgi:hypothetical protein
MLRSSLLVACVASTAAFAPQGALFSRFSANAAVSSLRSAKGASRVGSAGMASGLRMALESHEVGAASFGVIECKLFVEKHALCTNLTRFSNAKWIDKLIWTLQLKIKNGHSATIYPFGACVTSYKAPHEVLFIRPDAKFDGTVSWKNARFWCLDETSNTTHINVNQPIQMLISLLCIFQKPISGGVPHW